MKVVHNGATIGVQGAYFYRACCFGSVKGALKSVEVIPGNVAWYRSSCDTEFDNSEMASPVLPREPNM